MALDRLDHINIRTANLPAMSRFYTEVLGLPLGDRPPFEMNGAWHYCGDRAAVHLVEVARSPAGSEPRLEHFAFMASDLAAFLDRLQGGDVAYRVALVPSSNNRQVHIRDPDGNHIEIQFDASEEADLSEFPGR